MDFYRTTTYLLNGLLQELAIVLGTLLIVTADFHRGLLIFWCIPCRTVFCNQRWYVIVADTRYCLFSCLFVVIDKNGRLIEKIVTRRYIWSLSLLKDNLNVIRFGT